MATVKDKITAIPTVEYRGKVIDMGSFSFTIPPLKAKQMREHAAALDQISKFTKETTIVDGLDIAIPVIHAALTRNYPDLSKDDIEDLVDAGNFNDCIRAVLAQSGFKQGEPGES